MRNRVPWTCLLAAAGPWCAGCGDALSGEAARYIKPSIAVMKFENRAPISQGWDLGSGMRDILVDRLCATKRYYVVERPELATVVKELQVQHSGATREQDRARAGQLKNVQYLIKGTITDFGHVATNTGFLGLPALDVTGSGRRAVMGVTLYVVDVESGEIITSESIEESVRAGDVAASAQYKNVGFGGAVFYRTPLGRATAAVIDRAVRRITDTIASRPWQPRIALVQEGGTIVINGGANRRVWQGACYEVYQLGEPIVDPDTGDVIGHQPGKDLGRIRVREVRPQYSVATAADGSAAKFQVGQRCRIIPADQR
jgi:curli biogenesis system outer membrane secretion channel CsgG